MTGKTDDLSEKLDSGQSASGTGIAQAYGDHASATVTIQGITPEQVGDLLKAAGHAQQSKIEQLSRQLNTTQEAVRGFLQILKREDIPPERRLQTLAEIAQRHSSMMEHLSVLAQDIDEEAQASITRAREILGHADSPTAYHEADAFLARAEALYKRDFEQSASLAGEAAKAAARKLREAAASRAERGELSLMQLDYIQAAEHFKVAAELVGGHRQLRWEYLMRCGNAMFEQGDYKGDNGALEMAISLYRQLAQEYMRERRLWAMTQSNLGNALEMLGERESGTKRLEEAAAAKREALKGLPRERVPLLWAMAQNNLGGVLQLLGKRDSGTKRLEEAIAAYREALKEYKRQQAPPEWSGETQSNIGTALQVLGERESGTKRLEEAVLAQREALKELPRERVPLRWAMAQNGLGNALLVWGEKEGGAERLRGEAIAAYREALKEYTRERAPVEWARTQSNLGMALQVLGERESGTKRLEDAVAVHYEALTGFSRERAPLEWAAAHWRLGTALKVLGEREGGTKRLEEAASALGSARDAYRQAGMLQEEEDLQATLKSLQQMIAQRSGDSASQVG